MKKKLLTVLLSVMVAATMVACGKKEESGERQSRTRDTEPEVVINEEGFGDDGYIEEGNGDDGYIEEGYGDDGYIEEGNGDEGYEGETTGKVTLEEFYSSPEMKEAIDQQLEQAMAAYGAYYSDIYMEFDGNTMIYGYVYKQAMTLDSQELYDGLYDSVMQAIDSIRSESGVQEPITVIYEYYNPDGSLVGSASFTG